MSCSLGGLPTTGLLLVHLGGMKIKLRYHDLVTCLDDVILLHLEGLGSFVVVYPSSVEEEPKGRDRNAHLNDQ